MIFLEHLPRTCPAAIISTLPREAKVTQLEHASVAVEEVRHLEVTVEHEVGVQVRHRREELRGPGKRCTESSKH